MRRRERHPLLQARDADRVRRVLYLNGLRRTEIEDAMQEIELRALERPPHTRGATTAWACAVATNLAMDVHRRAARFVDQCTGEVEPATDASGQIDTREALRSGLASLSAELRATVVLRFYADLTIHEIAAATAVPEGTVKSRLHRAVGELRRALPREVLG